MSSQSGISGMNGASMSEPRGAMLFSYHVKVAASESSKTIVASSEFKFRVVDAHIVNHTNGGGSDTCTVRNGSDAITNAMDASGSAGALVRAATIDDDYATIDKGESLVVVTASGAPVDVYIMCVRE